MRRLAVILAAVSTLALSACATVDPYVPQVSNDPLYLRKTESQRQLAELPSPGRPVAVAVYGFTDQTGQFKPSDNGQTLSRAVTQGASSMLMKALQDAGGRQWFTVVEREQLRNLLNERQIIREMRERYLGEKDINPQALPALLFAGVLLEGGIIGYDTNTLTGGGGAGFLGISARTQYRQDQVTVYLRAVSVRTGEVLSTVTATKTIASRQLAGNAFKYVAFKELAEAETGYTTNEPNMLALQQAIEKAVYALIMEGAEQKLWSFADYKAAWPYQWRYAQERDGLLSAAAAERMNKRDNRSRAVAAGAVRNKKMPPAPAANGAPGPSAKLAPLMQPSGGVSQNPAEGPVKMAQAGSQPAVAAQ